MARLLFYEGLRLLQLSYGCSIVYDVNLSLMSHQSNVGIFVTIDLNPTSVSLKLTIH